MLIGSCYSFQGKSHKLRGDIPCQDASLVRDIIGEWKVLCTADGLGSCANSARGAKVAVQAASELCVNAFPLDGHPQAILAMLQTAFNYANRAIAVAAEADGNAVESYDTTLDVVIWNGSNKVYYGHSGDGGIFVLTREGRYAEITTPQEGEEAASVCPLRCGNAEWAFGVYEGDAAIVASFTDGIRDQLTPPLLRHEETPYDVELANRFLFADCGGMETEAAKAALQEHLKASVAYLQSPACCITDDVTMGILVNTAICVEQDPLELAGKPDFAKLLAERLERLYPDADMAFYRRMLEQEIQLHADKIQLDDAALTAWMDARYPLPDTPENPEKVPPETPKTPPSPEPEVPYAEEQTVSRKGSCIFSKALPKAVQGILKPKKRTAEDAPVQTIPTVEETTAEELDVSVGKAGTSEGGEEA